MGSNPAWGTINISMKTKQLKLFFEEFNLPLLSSDQFKEANDHITTGLKMYRDAGVNQKGILQFLNKLVGDFLGRLLP